MTVSKFRINWRSWAQLGHQMRSFGDKWNVSTDQMPFCQTTNSTKGHSKSLMLNTENHPLDTFLDPPIDF